MIMKKTIMTSILITAIAALMIPSTAFAGFVTDIGDVKDPIFTVAPSILARGLAYDGLTTLYYTSAADPNIYVADTSGASFGPIPNPGPRGFTCGGLDFDHTTGDLLCGTYDATGDYWTINPTTGVAVFAFNDVAFGGFDGKICFNQLPGSIDGVAIDSDGTIWTSDDGGRTLYHITAAGALIASFPMPSTSISAFAGCNSGITVAGNFLELVLLDLEPEEASGFDHRIVKVAKDDPTTVIVEFQVNDALCCEDIAFDANTYKPRAVVWTIALDFEVKAYDVQVTRTIGFWKNHSDLAEGLPITLGDGTNVGICQVVTLTSEITPILKAHKGSDAAPKLKAQLLAAKLNLALGDVPIPDQIAIAPTITAADLLLGLNTCEPDTGKRGDDRAEAQTLHGLLDAFNNLYSP